MYGKLCCDLDEAARLVYRGAGLDMNTVTLAINDTSNTRGRPIVRGLSTIRIDLLGLRGIIVQGQNILDVTTA